MLFSKIDLPALDIDFTKIYGGTPLVLDENSRFKICLIKDQKYLAEIFSTMISFRLRPCSVYLMEFQGSQLPHVDDIEGSENTALNYYFQSSGSITTFWKEKTFKGGVDHFKVGLNDEKIVSRTRLWADEDNLELLCSFTSQDHDYYLMDVSGIHGISEPNGTRKFLSWRWKESFDEVLNSIKVLNIE